MRSHRLFSVVSAAVVALVAAVAQADVKLPAIIGDNMVVQVNKPVIIWGWADAGEKVTVKFLGETGSAVADAAGKWTVKLPMITYPGGPHEMSIAGKNAITLKNILVGEVWVCSGQSNMQWTVQQSANPEQEIAAAKFPKIRLISVPRTPMTEPQGDFKGQWEECTPQTVAGFSAVAYYFGRDLHQALNIPVGLINTSYGGTPAEAWTSRSALEAQPSLKPLLERWDTQVKTYDAAKAKAAYDKQLAAWKEAAAKAKKENKQPPRGPQLNNPVLSPHRPANLFNGMINPIVPFAIRGAIWYQGESNASRAKQYQTVFPTMISDWRTRWAQGDFPFYFVQLANFRAVKDQPADSDWAELREAQTLTLKKLPNTGQAVIIDIGEANDIHPKNKQDVGKRLARWALNKDYGKNDVVLAGPTFKSVKLAGNKATITFDFADGLKTTDGSAPKGFAVAGADKTFYWAEAKIVGNTVELTSPKVEKIVAVRYAWADNPTVNLINSQNLPAGPFRTDTFPGITDNAN